jgi:hypothetical protein
MDAAIRISLIFEFEIADFFRITGSHLGEENEYICGRSRRFANNAG